MRRSYIEIPQNIRWYNFYQEIIKPLNSIIFILNYEVPIDPYIHQFIMILPLCIIYIFFYVMNSY